MTDERKHYCFLCDGTGKTYFEYKDYEALHFEREQLKRELDEALLELKRYKNMASACVNCRANLSEVESDK